MFGALHVFIHVNYLDFSRCSHVSCEKMMRKILRALVFPMSVFFGGGVKNSVPVQFFRAICTPRFIPWGEPCLFLISLEVTCLSFSSLSNEKIRKTNCL